MGVRGLLTLEVRCDSCVAQSPSLRSFLPLWPAYMNGHVLFFRCFIKQISWSPLCAVDWNNPPLANHAPYRSHLDSFHLSQFLWGVEFALHNDSLKLIIRENELFFIVAISVCKCSILAEEAQWVLLCEVTPHTTQPVRHLSPNLNDLLKLHKYQNRSD